MLSQAHVHAHVSSGAHTRAFAFACTQASPPTCERVPSHPDILYAHAHAHTHVRAHTCACTGSLCATSSMHAHGHTHAQMLRAHACVHGHTRASYVHTCTQTHSPTHLHTQTSYMHAHVHARAYNLDADTTSILATIRQKTSTRRNNNLAVFPCSIAVIKE